MNKEKQIDEMAKILCGDYNMGKCAVDGFNCSEGFCSKRERMHGLYNAGYRKADEFAREIFEEIEDVINNIGYFDELDFNALKKKYTKEE